MIDIFMTVFLAAGSLYAGIELGDPLFGVGMAVAAVVLVQLWRLWRRFWAEHPKLAKAGMIILHRAIHGGRAAVLPGRVRCNMHRSYQRFPRHLPKREAEIGGGFGTEHREYTVEHGRTPP